MSVAIRRRGSTEGRARVMPLLVAKARWAGGLNVGNLEDHGLEEDPRAERKPSKGLRWTRMA